MVNLISKRCEEEACDRIPSYNFDAVGAKAIYCNTHKAEGGVWGGVGLHRSVHTPSSSIFRERECMYLSLPSWIQVVPYVATLLSSCSTVSSRFVA